MDLLLHLLQLPDHFLPSLPVQQQRQAELCDHLADSCNVPEGQLLFRDENIVRESVEEVAAQLEEEAILELYFWWAFGCFEGHRQVMSLHFAQHVQYLQAHLLAQLKFTFKVVYMRLHLLPVYHLSPLLSPHQCLLHYVDPRLHIQAHCQLVEGEAKFVIIEAYCCESLLNVFFLWVGFGEEIAEEAAL